MGVVVLPGTHSLPAVRARACVVLSGGARRVGCVVRAEVMPGARKWPPSQQQLAMGWMGLKEAAHARQPCWLELLRVGESRAPVDGTPARQQ